MWFFPWMVSTACMFWFGWRLDQMRRNLSMEKSRNHAFCVSAIFSVVEDAHTASVLRRAAERWDSVEEQPRIRRIAQGFRLDGPSIPSLWLRAEADRLDPQKQEVDA